MNGHQYHFSKETKLMARETRSSFANFLQQNPEMKLHLSKNIIHNYINQYY